MSASEYLTRAALGPDVPLDEAETRAALDAAILRLPRGAARRAVRLVLLDEQPIDEVAPALGLTRAALRTLLAESLTALREDRALAEALGR